MRKIIRIMGIVSVTPTSAPAALFLLLILLVLVAVIIYLIHQSKKKQNTTECYDDSDYFESTLKTLDSEDTLRPDEPVEAAPEKKDSFVVQSAVINNKGRMRKNNEDNFCLNGTIMQREKMDDGANISCSCKDAVQLYAVCDGMGGIDNGEDASYAAVKILSERKKECATWSEQAEITRVLCSISDRIYRQSEEKGKKSGTTIVAVVLNNDKLTCVNVGDSRIYRVRNHELCQVSRDHSRVQRLISMGVITQEQAQKHPDRHIITQYLGMSSEIRLSPYYGTDSTAKEGDVYLLCSDGLTDMVSDKEIKRILDVESDPGNAARVLTETALKNGGRDNVTVMILKILKNSEGKKRHRR